MDKSIPFNKPFIAGKELFNIAQSVIQHGHLSGDGHFTKRCHAWLEKKLSCNKVLLTHSCTAALEMAAILAGVEPGDEVIMPSFTFVSTANAFVLRGGIPVFIDIKPDSPNIDEAKIEAAITERTKAIVPVHYAGVACNMDKILKIARKYKLVVIEDAAQSMLSSYNHEHLGTIGDLGTLSFHETKNIISGEGGALLINNQKFADRADIIWEKGTNRKAFFNGLADKYTWVDKGSSFLPSDMTAAFLYAQLEQADTINEKRLNIYKLYCDLLDPLEKKGIIRTSFQLSNTEKGNHNAHIFYILTQSHEERTELIDYLQTKHILSVFHYVPLHSSPAGKKYGKVFGDMENTDSLSGRILRLPIYFEMSQDDVEKVTSAITSFYKPAYLRAGQKTSNKKIEETTYA